MLVLYEERLLSGSCNSEAVRDEGLMYTENVAFLGTYGWLLIPSRAFAYMLSLSITMLSIYKPRPSLRLLTGLKPEG